MNRPQLVLSVMKVDYLLIGQGICGTFLSRELLRAGKKILVVDDGWSSASSPIAGGVMNPVTGKRYAATWNGEEVLPFAEGAYAAIGQDIGCILASRCDLIDFFVSAESRSVFEDRIKEGSLHLEMLQGGFEELFHYNYGAGRIGPCWRVDTGLLLQKWRDRLKEQQCLTEEAFDFEKLHAEARSVRYGDITAEKAIFCDGARGLDNLFWSMLPWSKNKGQAVIASIPGLPVNHIYKCGLTIAPWKDELFWIGSSYEWNYQNLLPAPDFRMKAAEWLGRFIRLPCNIVDHIAGERPGTVGQMPFVGTHPSMPSVGILNGMGSKGCSLAPYFARELCQFLTNGEAITPAADVRRFQRVLGRKS